jgi:hypothetical protein
MINDDLNLRPDRAIRESEVSSDGKIGKSNVNIRGSKVIAATCVD